MAEAFDDKIVELLKNGGVGVLPSDTVYGLSCLALNKKAVMRIHRIKMRDSKKPFIVLFSRLDQLDELGVDKSDSLKAARYWPGKLSLVCNAHDAPSWLQMGRGTLAVRQPDNRELLRLIDEIGPIISTSANISGVKYAATISHIKKLFDKDLDFYVDNGSMTGKPSTLAKPAQGKLKIIRQGALIISKEDQL
jgi:L-threonylcarbamoyladenylate synthase